MPRRPTIRLPRQWPRHVKSGILHAVALASAAIVAAQGRAAGRRRLVAELEQARHEIALLREEVDIKDGRWSRSRTRRRPHYTPTQRMRILQLRAARGWTLEKTARVFHLDRLERAAAALVRHPGLHLGGNSYRGISANDCIRHAGTLAERMLRASPAESVAFENA